MYKAVVVDDERYDLEGLRKLIPWEELNIEVVCWEHKPLGALKYIEEHQIDLLITDIKMPILSGLELAKRAQDLNPGLKKCFISGYQDFEFAKKAIDLKADGYVLKPVDDLELIEVLKGIVHTLEEKRDLQEVIEETADLRRQELVLGWLNGKLTKQNPPFAQNLQITMPQETKVVAVIELDRSLQEIAATSHSHQQMEEALAIVARQLEARGWLLWSKTAANRFAVILPQHELLPNELLALQQAVAVQSKLTITIGLSEPFDSEAALVQAYEVAVDSLSYKMFLGKNRMITRRDVPSREANKPEDVRPILDRMFQATMKYQLVEIYDCIEQLFSIVQHVDSPQKVYHFSTYITLKLQHDLSQINESFHSLLGWESSNIELLSKFETIDDIQRWLRSTLFEISETVYMRKQKRNLRLFDEIKEYVEERLASEITLKEVANYFAYSPNHLGYLFKETVGVSFNEYVLTQRMERAKALLRNHKLKVYEVADQTGYKSLTHFSRTFREVVGMTPGEFRKQSG